MSTPIERDDMLRVEARQALDALTDLVNNVALGGIAYAKTSYARTRLQRSVRSPARWWSLSC